MSRLKRSVAALLCLLLVGICAFAGEIDPDRACSLTVRCRYKVEGVVYSLWRVADVDEDVQFTLTSDFRKSRAKVNDLSEDGWQEAAEVLARWAEKKDIPRTTSGLPTGTARPASAGWKPACTWSSATATPTRTRPMSRTPSSSRCPPAAMRRKRGNMTW